MPSHAKNGSAHSQREAQSEQRFRALIEHSADAIALIDSQGKLLYASPSTQRLLGYTPEELLGRIAVDLVHPDDREHAMSTLAAVRHTQETSLTVEYRLQHKDGTWRWMEATATNCLHNPHLKAIVGNYCDITERKLAEQRKNEFISMASHELKTPVTSLKGFTQILQRRFTQRGDEESLRFLARMDGQINRLSKLINDMLDIVRLEKGTLAYREEPVDLAVLIQETVENLQASAPNHQLQLEHIVPASVFGDPDRLGQVIVNLIMNAIKYSPHADTVLIHISTEKQQATVSVQDFGIGIAEVHQQHLFERFYQVPDPMEKTFPGLGIGLYSASEIVKRHQGRIWVESKKGEGSTFRFTLPLRKHDTSSNSATTQREA